MNLTNRTEHKMANEGESENQNDRNHNHVEYIRTSCVKHIITRF